jgi:hypothetical protein
MVLTTLSLSMSQLSKQCGILSITQPYRPPRPVTGIALLYFSSFEHTLKQKSSRTSNTVMSRVSVKEKQNLLEKRIFALVWQTGTRLLRGDCELRNFLKFSPKSRRSFLHSLPRENEMNVSKEKTWPYIRKKPVADNDSSS